MKIAWGTVDAELGVDGPLYSGLPQESIFGSGGIEILLP